MKVIEIEKELYLDDVVDILTLDMKEDFLYRNEEDGIRCMGPFYIKGRYTTLNEVKDFQDVFEFDVFASNEKLDREPFKIAYEGYDYTLKNQVVLYLHFKVFGIKSEEEEQPIVLEATALPEEEQEEDIEENYEPMTINESEKENDKVTDLSMMEELFDDKDNVITSYSFVVVKKDDNYQSIARRYQVDEEALIEINNHKELHEKNLIVLPYRVQ